MSGGDSAELDPRSAATSPCTPPSADAADAPRDQAESPGTAGFAGGAHEARARARPPRWALALLAALALFAVKHAYDASARLQNDFATYYLRAADAAQGLNPYRDVTQQSPYIYPPLLLALFRPLTALPPGGAAVAWTLVQILALCACARLAVDLLDRAGRRPPAWVLWLPTLLALRFVLRELTMGQVNVVVLAVTLGGLAALARGCDAAAGALLGLATVLKILPGLFALLLVCRRRWRALAWMCVGGLAGLVLPALIWGPARTIEVTSLFVHGRILTNVSDLHMDVHAPNQSLYALMMRLLTDTSALVPGWNPQGEWFINVAHWSRPHVALLFAGIALALLAASARAIGRATPQAIPECIALLFCLTALISRKTWEEHCVTFVQVYATLLVPPAGALESDGRTRALWHSHGPLIFAVAITWFYGQAFVGPTLSDEIQAFGPVTLAALGCWLTLRRRIADVTGS